MRADRRGTKKLVVAFHFHLSDQAGWRCDECRQRGLESKRRCGWLPETQNGPHTVVWAKGGAVAHSCPKTLITTESLAFLEQFWAWKLVGGVSYPDLAARVADAFSVLEGEFLKIQSK